MTEPQGPDNTDNSANLSTSPLWRRLQPLLAVTGRAHAALNTVCVFGAIGVVTLVVGLLKLGLTGPLTVLALVLGAVAAVPVYVAWQGSLALAGVLDLPRQLSARGELAEHLLEEAASTLRNAAEIGVAKSLIGLPSVVTEAVRAVPGFTAASDSPRTVRPFVLHRVVVSSVMSLAVFGVGLGVLLAGAAI